MLAASAPNCYLQLCCCCRYRIAPSAPKRGRFTQGSLTKADGPLTYQREQKVMPHPGRVQGRAHRSRVCLHDLGHVPCHLSAVWGCHQPYQVLGDRKALCWSPVWSDIGLGLACWSFTSHSAGGWRKMHFCLVQLQEELCCLSPRQAGDQYPLVVLLEAFRRWEPCQAPGQCCPGSAAHASPQTFMWRGCAGE